MADLIIAASVSVEGGGSLDLNDGETHKIMQGGWGPGSVVWRRQAISSVFAHGRYLTSAQKEQVISPLGVRTYGADEDGCLAAVGTLVAAFEQFSYELTMTIGATTFTWECEPADYMVGDSGAIQKFHLMSFQQETMFDIPHFPIPVAGPF